ncbi:MAG: hypothetical protein K6B65_00990 [Bacilli bacterium]|nr:hypothetical protein [Bacilli bacterium]
MFRLSLLSLLSAFMAIPTLAGWGAFSLNQDAVNAETSSIGEGETLHGYTYVDSIDGGAKSRTFDSHELAPEIQPYFCAPKGYVYKLSIKEEAVAEIVDQIVFLGANLDYFHVSYYYGIYGTEVFSSSNSRWYEGDISQTEWMKQALLKETDGLTLTNIEEIDNAAELYARVEVMVTVPNEELGYDEYWNVVVVSEKMEIEPYSESDFIEYGLQYYGREDAKKTIEVDCHLIPGFFNQYDVDKTYAYNPYGWKTDTTTIYPYAPEPRPDGNPHYFCDYELTLIAFDKVNIGTFNMSYALELSYPDTPIRAKIKLAFTANSIDYVFYSDDFMIGDPNVRIIVDGAQNRGSVQKGTEHSYTIQYDNLESNKFLSLDLGVDGIIDRLNHDGERVIYCYEESGLPEKGSKGVYYYLPSENEKSLHAANKDEEFLKSPSEGKYYIWDDEIDPYSGEISGQSFKETTTVDLIDVSRSNSNDEPIPLEELDSLLNHKLSLPYSGRLSGFSFSLEATFEGEGSASIRNSQTKSFEITPYVGTDDTIVLDVPDALNLIDGGEDIIITPKVSSFDEKITYYHNHFISKEGIIETNQDSQGRVTIHPLKSGVVSLTFEIDSIAFSKISKTISVRVLDGIYNNSKIEVKDEFHKAGDDVTASISVRNFTDIRNAKIAWKVLDKTETALPAEKLRDNGNASLTLLSPDSGDYTIVATYEDIELARTTLQVRYIDMDAFLRANIWWIVLITLIILVLVIILITFSKRSKGTVARIKRVYEVYCECISNDTLSKEELIRIKREISRCLHHCESLNIDTFNQYEKATKYLRKSLTDTKTLMKKREQLSEAEKSVMYEKLNDDLSKALTAAREIEAAKKMIEQNHALANRQNYVAIKEDKPKKKTRK